MSTVKKFEKQPVIPEPPNTRTDTKAVFLQKADTFNPALKAWADSFNASVVDNLNALVDVLNAQLPYINTVADADAAIRAVYTAIAQVNTVSAGIESVNTCATWMEKIKLVAENMAEVVSAQGYAEEAKKWALMAEAVVNVKPATKEALGLVIVGDGLDVDTNGAISVPTLSEASLPAHASRHGAAGNDPITSLGPISEKTQTLGPISGSVTIDLSAGLSVSATIGDAVTLAFTNVPVSGTTLVVLRLTNGGTAAVTWPAAIVWAGNKAPTLTASGKDMIVLITDDGGTTWWGSASFKYGAGA